MIRIAFAGCAHIHTPAFVNMLKERSQFSVVRVWDPNPERAKNVADVFQAKVCSSCEEIRSDASIDAVIVTSETNLHREIAPAMALAKKHLFVEKPLGFSAQDARSMAKIISDSGVLFQTGYFMRGFPAHLFLKQLVEEGAFGVITRIRHSNCHSGSLGGWFDTQWRWMADPAIAGCGAFGDLATHSLDIIMWLMGRPCSIAASIHTVTRRYGENCDESGEALLEFPSGAVGTLAGGWVDVANPVTCEISGTNGYAAIVNGQLLLQGCGRKDANGAPWSDLPAPLPHAFQLFLDKLEGKDAPLITVNEAADRSIVMEAAYRSNANHSRINIEY